MISKFANKRRQGFSLMEFAIVLAIFGIVLASLWGVVSIVRENIKRDETVEQLTAVVSKVRDYYMGRACASNTVDLTCPNANANLTDYLFRQAVLLPEQLRDRTAGTLVADHTWGGDDADGSLIVRAVDDGRQSFSVELNSLKRESCTALAGSLSGAGGPKGLLALSINGDDIAQLPIAPEIADAECDDDDPKNTLLLTYRLRP